MAKKKHSKGEDWLVIIPDDEPRSIVRPRLQRVLPAAGDDTFASVAARTISDDVLYRLKLEAAALTNEKRDREARKGRSKGGHAATLKARERPEREAAVAYALKLQAEHARAHPGRRYPLAEMALHVFRETGDNPSTVEKWLRADSRFPTKC